jgi:CheY-like chemotaxis protein
MVLTDYCMPEMTGYELLKAIKVTHLLAATS